MTEKGGTVEPSARQGLKMDRLPLSPPGYPIGALLQSTNRAKAPSQPPVRWSITLVARQIHPEVTGKESHPQSTADG